MVTQALTTKAKVTEYKTTEIDLMIKSNHWNGLDDQK